MISNTSRCLIPECDTSGVNTFEPSWLSNAVPYSNGKPAKCSRYPSLSNTSSSKPDELCDRFDHFKEIGCDNQFVYKTDEISILNGVSTISTFN